MASCKALNPVMGIFWLLSSFVLLGTSTRLLTDQQEDLVSTACNSTLYVEVCISSLRSDPRSETSDLRGLADIAVNLSIAHGVETLAYINNLKSKAGSGPQNKYTCLNDCIEEYDEAVQNLQDSIHALRIRFYDKVNTLVSAAMTDSDTCEDCFKETEENQSPLTERNQYFSKLCSNFLAITKRIF